MTTREESFDTARLRALAEAATTGPWYQGQDNKRYENSHEVFTREDPYAPDSYDVYPAPASTEDAAYIAAADPATVIALLDEIESLRDQVDSLQLENEMLHVTNRTNNQYLLDEIERLRGEGEWEYAWAGEDWLLEDEVFPSPQVAENWVGLLSTRRWVREEGGYLVRRRAAGPWEPAEEDGDA